MTREARVALAALVVATSAVAAIGARPFAGGWNDGSRLAAAESLVDTGGWAIDRSIFVEPAQRPAGAPAPYPRSDRLLSERGTLDRLLIDGHYYSDKTPVLNLGLAGEYWLLQRTSGLVARVRADRFCYWLTLFSAGLSFVVASGAMFALACRTTGSVAMAAGVAASFAFATCAAAYSRHVNSHQVLLGVLALLMLALDGAARARPFSSAPRLLWVGTLAGLAYGIDAALGPLTLIVTLVLMLWRSPARVWMVALAAGPWVALHHALNYLVGHTLGPANTVAAYLAWPGSPFDPASMTGHYAHATVGHALKYSLDLLAGRRGFLLHNLPLLMLPIAAWRVAGTRRALEERPAAIAAVVLIIGGWLIYALGSTNHSGVALTIRWFVPLLAPAFYLLMLDVRDVPADRAPFVLLSAAGAAMALLAWVGGPWQPRVPLFWWWLAIALVSCGVLEWRRRRRRPVGNRR